MTYDGVSPYSNYWPRKFLGQKLSYINNLTTIQELEFDRNLKCIADAIFIYYIIVLCIVKQSCSDDIRSDNGKKE